jgi:hypothetical protein
MHGLTQVNTGPGVKGVRRKHVATMAQRIIGRYPRRARAAG